MEQHWKDKISNPLQLGGIETSTLDNGSGRGTRIAWFNTGGGLRFKIVIDRAMDIADAFYNNYSLAWLGHLGVTAPQPFSNQGIDWLKTFGGGLLTTCGLDHVGGPEEDEFGRRGLHGEISNIPAEIESIIQPDPLAGKLEMSITGIIRQTRIFGSCFELRRKISGTLGDPKVSIHDEVINRGNTAIPYMVLYHINFGWPLVDEGTKILWEGAWTSREGELRSKVFKQGNDFRLCPAPIQDHNGDGEEAAFISPVADKEGNCVCGLYNSKIQLALGLRFNKDQLPWLINWQHWGINEYVTALEPATNPPIGQSMARKQNQLIFIAPGEKRQVNLQLEVVVEESSIKNFLTNFTH
ncbi:MAG: aldose 1-epimerase family protein [Cytophagales bacterium]|jgi:galactose mutarotase-like enzyme|nr:aldose 1-epimerase family protein [Cytophagales bacterium]MCA6388946.1 aldose 1-epimerase family protein [Cytophagales bacterium]MCA6391364.1 aldose 1-epimerase family protein [Cytophagales bacterium]MCA6395283.1 aldose 1-epimerase family protein [Cytophagales bacterium]MCA6398421.1 aldose 1-epimerase family protein [Cytophagales bacterium]